MMAIKYYAVKNYEGKIVKELYYPENDADRQELKSIKSGQDLQKYKPKVVDQNNIDDVCPKLKKGSYRNSEKRRTFASYLRKCRPLMPEFFKALTIIQWEEDALKDQELVDITPVIPIKPSIYKIIRNRLVKVVTLLWLVKYLNPLRLVSLIKSLTKNIVKRIKGIVK